MVTSAGPDSPIANLLNKSAIETRDFGRVRLHYMPDRFIGTQCFHLARIIISGEYAAIVYRQFHIYWL